GPDPGRVTRLKREACRFSQKACAFKIRVSLWENSLLSARFWCKSCMQSALSMTVFAPNEQSSQETRAALTPPAVSKLTALGLRVQVESGLGDAGGFTDDEYRSAG